MVWDGGSKPLVVPTRWSLLGVALGGAPYGGNVDPCPREGEGAEGSNRCRVWLSLFLQCSANGGSLGLVS